MAQDKLNLLSESRAREGGADKAFVVSREPANYQCKYHYFNNCPNRVLIPMTPCEECKGKGYLT